MEWGKTKWAIAEGFIPEQSTGPIPEMESHETLCVLNAGPSEAKLVIMVSFADRDPAGPFIEIVPPRRTRHIRFNNFASPENIPKGVDYSCTIESNVSVIIQHTRLDSRQTANALMTTIAYSE